MAIKVLEEVALEDRKVFRIGWFMEGREDPYQAEYWTQEDGNYLVVGREIAGRKLVFDEPYVFLKESVSPGDTWTEKLRFGGRELALTFTAGDWEPIATDIGTFDAIKVSVSGPPQSVERWYAPSIGMVKEITRLTLGGRTSPGNEKTLFRHRKGEAAPESGAAADEK